MFDKQINFSDVWNFATNLRNLWALNLRVERPSLWIFLWQMNVSLHHEWHRLRLSFLRFLLLNLPFSLARVCVVNHCNDVLTLAWNDGLVEADVHAVSYESAIMIGQFAWVCRHWLGETEQLMRKSNWRWAIGAQQKLFHQIGSQDQKVIKHAEERATKFFDKDSMMG